MDIESWYSICKLVLLVSAIFTAISLAGIHFLGNIVDSRNEKKIETLQTDLEKEKNTIRDFEAKISIKITGKWDTPPIIRMMSPTNHEVYMLLLDSNSASPIKFFAKEPYFFVDNKDGSISFHARVAVNKGDDPIGRNKNTFDKYTTIQLQIPFVAHKDIKDEVVNIKNIQINPIINAISMKGYNKDENKTIQLEQKNKFWALLQIPLEKDFFTENIVK